MSEQGNITAVIRQRVDAIARERAKEQAQVKDIPKSLENTDRASRLKGRVVKADNDGNVRIRTDQGDVTIKIQGKNHLKTGDQVEIKLDSATPPQTATVRVTTKEAPPPAPNTSVPPELKNIQVQQSLTASELLNGAPIKVTQFPASQIQTLEQPFITQLPATLSNAALLSNNTPPPLLESTQVAPQTLMTLTQSEIINASTRPLEPSYPQRFTEPTNAPLTTTSFATPQTQVPLSRMAAQLISTPLKDPITIPSAKEQQVTTPYVFTDVKVDAVEEPRPIIAPHSGRESLILQPPQEARAGETVSTFIGLSADRHFPVLQINMPQNQEATFYTLQVPVKDIPIGAQITLQVTQSSKNFVQTTATTLPNTIFPPLTSLYFITPETWPVMQDIQTTLIQATTTHAQNTSAFLPSPAAPQQMGPAIMFFVAAMRSGDIQSWLGERVIDTLQKAGKTESLNRLGREMNALNRFNSESIAQDWKSMSLPMMWQNEIHKIVLHYRHDQSESDSSENETGHKTRFVMDLSLSHMGKLQLDALFSAPSNGPARLDLVLRAEQHFSEGAKQAMRCQYKNALEETKIAGDLSFQGRLNDWVHISPTYIREYSKDV